MKDVDQEELSRRRGIYFQSFGIYGGLSGLYDYGPVGSRIKDNVARIWKEMMMAEGAVAEFDGTSLTHESVLKASGHYDRFFDFYVECTKCKARYRPDELLERRGISPILEKEWLQDKISQLNLRCENCGGAFGEVMVQKLMFQVEQGSDIPDLFLRPETAQGIFINFKEYYRFFREKLPFAIITIGRGYRNEISPRKALYRLREFNMMECESFYDPNDEKWIKDIEGSIKTKFITNTGQEFYISPKEAYERNIVKSHPIAYFIGFALAFYSRIGIDLEKVRFRQHRKEELSHYSSDTWDAEALTDIGWIEITGIAHRGTFDLSNHIKYSGKDLYAQRIIPKRELLKERRDIDYASLKNDYPKNYREIIEAINQGNDFIELDGNKVDLSRYYKSVVEKVVVDREKFIPVVIEPSFGLDRIIYTILDHSMSVREDSGYIYLRLPYEISPYDLAVLPLMNRDGLAEKAQAIFNSMLQRGLKAIYDDSGSIGKRYARYDEIGITYCVTIDYDTLKDDTVTVRHRDSMQQIRVHYKELPEFLKVNPWNGKKG
ncbi:MAG: glycine--tRNA ligase [Thermoplasmatales archaeon]